MIGSTHPSTDEPRAPVTVLAVTARDRAKLQLKNAFPKRRARLVIARSVQELDDVMRRELVDAVILDLATPTDETAEAIQRAREFPHAPFFGLSPLRPSDASLVARCAASDFADVLVDGVDEGVLRLLVSARAFSTRFAEALREAPPQLHMNTPIKKKAWAAIVGAAGRPIHTDELAATLAISREHLSRGFSAEGAPNVKRVIDLVRLLAAAELAKSPGFDIGDVANILRYASSSHLSTTAQRIVGTKPSSLARLRAVDLIDRFVQGRTRSRN